MQVQVTGLAKVWLEGDEEALYAGIRRLRGNDDNKLDRWRDVTLRFPDAARGSLEGGDDEIGGGRGGGG